LTKREGGESPLFTLSGRIASQQPRELAAFIDILNGNGVRSYLEIGAKHGDTFYEVMTHLPTGSRGVAIDLPSGPWRGGGSAEHLTSCINELNRQYDVERLFGDSQAIELSENFGAILIDADHRYESVKKDWLRYKDRSRIIAFHDIAAPEGSHCGRYKVEVQQLWNEIKHDYQNIELIMPDDNRPMGIGVLFL